MLVSGVAKAHLFFYILLRPEKQRLPVAAKYFLLLLFFALL